MNTLLDATVDEAEAFDGSLSPSETTIINVIDSFDLNDFDKLKNKTFEQSR